MKKIKIFIVLFLFVFALLLINKTYSKYRDNIEGITDINIASWNIKVNTESILNKTTLNNVITPTFPGTEYIKSGILAPGSEGYYDIIIDPSDVDVAFEYTITPTLADDNTINDLIITGYEINPTEPQNILVFNTNITGSIPLNSSSVTVRIHILWDDSIDATMNNEDDTSAVSNANAKASIKNTLEFEQTID